MSRDQGNPEIQLPNPHLKDVKEHFLYHLGISSAATDFPATFGDVKFVCIGGTGVRVEKFAQHLAGELSQEVMPCCPKTERYSLFKVGPVLCASHGIGVPSLSVLLHEIFKLLHLSKCSNVILLRIGTCGGIGVDEGEVVISSGVLNGNLQTKYTWHALGKSIERDIVVDLDLANELHSFQKDEDLGFRVVLGKTLCADDFYEGQARLDGAVCLYTSEERDAFIQDLKERGVVNIEMESAGVLALCHAVSIKAAVVCVCVVNRLESEQPKNNSSLLHQFEQRPQILVSRFIKNRLKSI